MGGRAGSGREESITDRYEESPRGDDSSGDALLCDFCCSSIMRSLGNIEEEKLVSRCDKYLFTKLFWRGQDERVHDPA